MTMTKAERIEAMRVELTAVYSRFDGPLTRISGEARKALAAEVANIAVRLGCSREEWAAAAKLVQDAAGFAAAKATGVQS